MKHNKKILGVATNDATHKLVIKEKIEGKWKIVWKCPAYQRWMDMIHRCYNPTIYEKYPTYKRCSVCEEWLTFSNFYKWIIEQDDWENCDLDKDLLIEGNTVYSPDTCIMLPHLINTFLLTHESRRGDYLIGVGYDKRRGYFTAHCRDPFKYRQQSKAGFLTEHDAHVWYLTRKIKYAEELAETVTDERIKEALLRRYNDRVLQEFKDNKRE